MSGSTLKLKKRLLFMLVTFSILLILLIVRTGWIQIVKGDEYQQKALANQTINRDITPKRGTIYDRNGKELAVSASVESISVNPQIIKDLKIDPQTISQKLSELLQMDEAAILKKITKKSRFEYIKRKVDSEIAEKVREWRTKENISGLYIDEDTKRFYPNRNLAAHVIGFTGDDNQGLNGIEKTMDKYLKGVPGKILSEVDARGREVPFKQEKYIAAEDGLNVVLTIDETIQSFAENAMEKAIIDNKLLNGAAAIVMDPRTGDILAMTSKPDFDLNDPFAFPKGVKGIDEATWNGHTNEDVKTLYSTVWRNKAVNDTYEPGSTFKAITSAAGLEENVITPESRVNDFTIQLGGWDINCWKPNAHGEESFREGVYNSCNPVFVRVAQSLGVKTFFKYMKAFGFYDSTGIEIPGESKSIIFSDPQEIDMAVASFGQRFQITPIQLITAYGAIANGGTLMKPRVVSELTDSEGNIVKKIKPEAIREVISKNTADTLKDILEGVVSVGTGKNAYVRGYRVAGKTGTSQTLEKGHYVASFSAIAPADNPVICVLVVLDYPTGDTYYGGQIAAPVAGKLVEDTLNYLEVERRYTELDKEMMLKEVYVPETRKLTLEQAEKKLSDRNLNFKVEGSADNGEVIVKEQMPKPNAIIPEKSVVVLYTYQPEKEIKVKMPNVLNKTISEATDTLNSVGLNIRVSGMGTAIEQPYEPGQLVEKGSVVEVTFRSLETD